MQIEEEKKNIKLDRSMKAPYFFKRTGDGYIFAVDEIQAWEHIRGQGNWARRDFVYLGHSDGLTYKKVMRESANERKELQKGIDQIRKDIVKFLKTEERLRFEELLDDTDVKVKRVKTLVKELEDKLEPLEAKMKDFANLIQTKAFNAELEIASLNKDLPQNQNVITPGGNREKILKQMAL